MQFDEVKLRGVAFVLAETILGKTRAKFTHHGIACDFRDHARGRDAQTVAIAIDDRGLGQREGKHRQAIDEDVFGLKGETGEGEPHGFVRGAQDVDVVDLH